jgi:hypothetical protein
MIARRLTLSTMAVLCSLVGVLALFCVPALAGVPAVETKSASEVAPTQERLTGSVNPEGLAVSECFFEYGQTTAYGQRVPCEQTSTQIGEGTSSVAVSASIPFQRETTYHYRLVAVNGNGQSVGQDVSFTSYPKLSGEAVSRVSTTEAEIQAQISAGGQLTSYRVEYGESEAYGSSTPEQSLGAPGGGAEPGGSVDVSVRLQGLRPGTRYFARMIVNTALGATQEGVGISLTTPKTFTVNTPTTLACPNRAFAGFNTALPDCRAYELVSDGRDEVYVPPYGEPGPEPEDVEHGIYGTGEYVGTAGPITGLYRVTTNGEKLIYVGGESVSGVGGNGSTGTGAGNQYVSKREANGWKASDISLPINANYGALFEVFSADLSVDLVLADAPSSQPLEATPAPAPECVAQATDAVYSDDANGLHALVTANRGSGSCYGKPSLISANDSHLLFTAKPAYVEGAHAGTENVPVRNIYDSVGGVLHQVNILPNGEAEQTPDAAFGSIAFGSENREGDKLGAVSADGSRIFWTEEAEHSANVPVALYVRENDTQPQSSVSAGKCTVPTDACTVQIDANQGGTGIGGGGYFWGATENSNKVFFSDCNRLTPGSTADAQNACVEKSEFERKPTFRGNDLYEYDFEKPVGQRLTDLTIDHNAGDPLGADVQGVVGSNGNGSYLYFVADGSLAGSNAEGKSPVAGQPNLYVIHEGSTSFIVTLANSDNNNAINNENNEYEVGDWQPVPGRVSAQVSPDGETIAFLSQLELTGYDNNAIVFRDNKGEVVYKHIPELFIYQASTGRIVCASCSPSGAMPIPLNRPRARLAGATVATSLSSSFLSRWIVDREGTQAYFMSTQPLVAGDSNDLMDVYEWQSDGSGGCRLESGCVSLISSAESASNAYLIGSGEEGRDVFFTSRSPLTKGAAGEALKVFDARIGGGHLEPSLSCTGTGCQGSPPAPPIFATPSSVTFNGVGNFEPVPPVKAKPKVKSKKVQKCKAGFHREGKRCIRERSKQAKKKARKTLTRKGR